MAEKGGKVRNRSAANSGRIPFAPAYVPELYDSRLSSDEKVLLWKIRYRSGSNEGTWISWETMAMESAKSRATMMRQIKKLRDLGFLASESRGFGKTTDKVVECPTAIYPQDLCDSHTVGKYFQRDRDDDILSELMSSSLISETTGDEGDGQAPRKSHQRDSISLTSETPLVSPVRHELDKENNINELDSVPTPSGSRENQQAGPRDLDGSKSNGQGGNSPFVNSLGVKPGDNRDIASLNALAHATSRQTLVMAREKYAARKAGQAEREASGVAERARQYRRDLAKENEKPAFTMGRLFEVAFQDNFPDAIFATWMKKEYSQANDLLKKYKDNLDLIFEAWLYACENWDSLKKRLKLTEGYPTVGALLALHARIFPEVQKVKTTREVVEGKAGQLDNKVGW